ncbi:hypothetical protein [Streptomyces alanosinicus]|uniref:Uncharacterized protein n=1 Tax=Streptomyces alanosinicus TaxID=68171 RepID=A0A918YNX1_9ACTN|nr:hypothetical protein [Streptomyces alanosinicus]GHE11029.1 hypothetical protein GCM10010339_69200 [Streptomyces alanosinicus]
MTSEHDTLWRLCTRLGCVLLPLVDQEPWRQTRRHENLRTWGISTVEGERLIEVFTALAAHAAANASTPPAEFDALPLRAVADAATGKRDIELLAGLPDTFTGSRDEQAAGLFRLYAYKGGQYSRRLFQLGTEVRHALVTLAERSPEAALTCGDVLRQAADEASPLQ